MLPEVLLNLHMNSTFERGGLGPHIGLVITYNGQGHFSPAFAQLGQWSLPCSIVSNAVVLF